MIALFLAVAASFAFTVGTTPFLIKWLRAQAIGQQIRDDGPVEHPHVNKVGTPTMGGITLVAGACIGYGVAHLRRSDFKFSRSGLLLMGLVLGCMAIGSSRIRLLISSTISSSASSVRGFILDYHLLVGQAGA